METAMQELIEWRIIDDMPRYSVSNHGDIKNNDTGRIISPVKSKGYLLVGLYCNGIRFFFPRHRLVAMAFIPNPDNKPQVNHINGIKSDNRHTNLEWCTSSENIKHAYSFGLCENVREATRKMGLRNIGKKSHRKKLLHTNLQNQLKEAI